MKPPLLLVGLLLLSALSMNVGWAQQATDPVAQGEAALNSGQFEEAESIFRQLTEADAGHAEAWFLLARSLVKQKNWSGARNSIDSAIDLDPENVSYLELKFEIGRATDNGSAIQDLALLRLSNRILDLDSLSIPANLRMGHEQKQLWLDGRKQIQLKELVRGVDRFDVETQVKAGAILLDFSYIGEEAFPIAENHFDRVRLRDPANEGAVRGLAAVYLSKRDSIAAENLARSVQRADPTSWTGWAIGGWAANRQQQYEKAHEQFALALEVMPDSIRAVFEDPSRVLRLEDPNVEGLTVNLESEEPPPFWTARDTRQLTPWNERMLEHFARLTYAWFVFPELEQNRVGWNTDRGDIHVRYGLPIKEYLLWSPVDPCPGDNQYSKFHIYEYYDYRFVFGRPVQAYENEFHFFTPCAQVQSWRLDYVTRSRETIQDTPDRFIPEGGAGRVEFPYLVSIFKGGDGRADIIVPYGVRIPYIPRRGGLGLPLRTGAFLLSELQGLLDESRRDVSVLDERSLFDFAEADFWFDVHTLSAAAGSSPRVSVEFETAESGAIVGFHQSAVDVPDFDVSDLLMSDLMLAYSIEEAGAVAIAPQGSIVRDDLVIRPAPWGVFRITQPLYFYFEAYNMQTGASGASRYRIEAALAEDQGDGIGSLFRRAFGRRPEGVSLVFDETSATPDVSRYLIMNIRDQEPGTYVLAVRMTDLESGSTVEKSRTVILE